MDANEYQKLAARTLIEKPDRPIPELELGLVVEALNLAVYAGVPVERAKKGIFHNHNGFSPREVLSSVKQLGTIAILFEAKPVKLFTHQIMVLWVITGLVGEAAELAHIILTWLCNRNISREDIAADVSKELGDCLWYLSSLCSQFGLNLADVMEENIAKLKTRYPNGYSSEDSQRRVDVEVSQNV